MTISWRIPGEDNVQFQSGGILARSVSGWEMRKWLGGCPRVHFARRNLPQRTTNPFQNFILFEEFQIALPLKRNGTILRGN
jgi:hypothetical protein